MPELPTCECVRGLPPYDRLTAIYQAAAELSGDTSLPDASCVSGVPPFQRFGYIYAAFRVLAGDDTLPSMECVEGEPPVDQVTRIYEAVFAYAADGTLLAVDCVQGLPIWRQWHAIYTALYTASGDESLTDPLCVPATFDVLSDVFCSLLVQGCTTPVLESAILAEDGILTMVFSEPLSSAAIFVNGLGFELEVGAGNFAQLSYDSGNGTSTIVFQSDIVPTQADVILLGYSTPPGDATNEECPLESFSNFPVDNPLSVFTYLRPGGSFTYLRPGGVDTYLRP